MSELPASLLLCFGPLLNEIKWPEHEHCDTTTVGLTTVTIPERRVGWQHTRPGYSRQRGDSRQGGRKRLVWGSVTLFCNGTWFKTYELFISGIFYLIFLDCHWPWVTETVESESTARRENYDLFYAVLFCETYQYCMCMWISRSTALRYSTCE